MSESAGSSNGASQLTHWSSLREKVFEHLLLGQLGVELLARNMDFTILHAFSDRDGYDVVIEAGRIVRHIQLKVSRAGGRTAAVPINMRLAAKPSGCVLWMVFDPESRSFSELRWFGGEPGDPLPELGDRPVRHSRANADGVKAFRPDMRSLRRSRFTRLQGMADLADRLLGIAPMAEAA